MLCFNGKQFSIPIHRLHATTKTVFHQQLADKARLIDSYLRASLESCQQSALNLRSGGITASMENAPARMGALAPEQQSIRGSMSSLSRLLIICTVKLYTYMTNQPVNSRRSPFYENPYRFFVTQTSACRQRILHMQFRTIIGPSCRRQSP